MHTAIKTEKSHIAHVSFLNDHLDIYPSAAQYVKRLKSMTEKAHVHIKIHHIII